mmetsp:Transcript_23808/g.39912  ORF Transcript_23808/g.39912 Transcript_23808/m.39912 type:complete len:247 (+) Transcript_23808:1220-1960(+)
MADQHRRRPRALHGRAVQVVADLAALHLVLLPPGDPALDGVDAQLRELDAALKAPRLHKPRLVGALRPVRVIDVHGHNAERAVFLAELRQQFRKHHGVDTAGERNCNSGVLARFVFMQELVHRLVQWVFVHIRLVRFKGIELQNILPFRPLLPFEILQPPQCGFTELLEKPVVLLVNVRHVADSLHNVLQTLDSGSVAKRHEQEHLVRQRELRLPASLQNFVGMAERQLVVTFDLFSARLSPVHVA